MSTPPSESELPVECVTEDIIRQLFNNGKFFERVQSGEIRTRITRHSHPDKIAQEPICTWSQMVLYIDENDEPLAHVHQYLRPDGTIGASGRPDPKRLFLPDRTIFVRSKPPQAQTE